MAWIVLIISGILEAVWATALGRSEGLTRLSPTIIFFVALVFSMAGLAYSMRTLPTGMSYVIWVGIGATLTVVYGMLTDAEPVSILKILFILGIIVCILGLKLTH